MTKTLTIPTKDIHTIVREEVIDVVREILSDPDAGLELTQNFIRRIKKSLKGKKTGKITPLLEVLKQYGI